MKTNLEVSEEEYDIYFRGARGGGVRSAKWLSSCFELSYWSIIQSEIVFGINDILIRYLPIALSWSQI